MPPSASFLVLALAAPLAGAATLSTQDMMDLSLEQLSNIVITSVSRQEGRLSTAPASLYIISAADIRRSGARSLPEALRLAPNLQVARVDARNYAVTARGFNSAFENKLLMLIDGRSVYTPLFSGVFWDAQDVVMEDIARIEVISGPGATIWGVNAVNGVINVITKPASQTQGGLASATVGEHERHGQFRYGGELANGAAWRAYAKADQIDDSVNAAGKEIRTGWRRSQAGFRSDYAFGERQLTVSGDAYTGRLAQANTRDIRIGGANLLGRLTMKSDAASDVRAQVILDHTERDQPNAFVESLDTLDLEFQHDVRSGSHTLAWGAGYRYSWDRLVNGPAFGFLPADFNMHWTNVFVQDEMAITPALRLTAGLKLEHNVYTGLEKLPNLRLAYTPDDAQLWWTSLSRTVRAPSRIDRDFYSPPKPPFGIAGGPQFASETADVLEIGYRAQLRSDLTFSATAFGAEYGDLRTLELIDGRYRAFQNKGEGRTRGIELWSAWQPAQALRLQGGLVIQHVETRLLPGSTDSSGTSGLATNDPNRHWLLRASYDWSERSQFDLTVRYNGALPKPVVPSYYEMDAQWVWKATPKLDIALIGQNLLHRQHAEWGASPGRSVYERSVLLRADYRF